MSFFFILSLLFIFIVLAISFAIHLYNAFTERFSGKQRNALLICLSITLVSTIIKPTGFIPNDILEGNDIFLAARTSDIDCNTELHLKKNHQFIQKSFCFGLQKQTGNYYYKKDTIWFESDDLFYNYGIIVEKDKRAFFNLYNNDSITNILVVLNNDLSSKE